MEYKKLYPTAFIGWKNGQISWVFIKRPILHSQQLFLWEFWKLFFTRYQFLIHIIQLIVLLYDFLFQVFMFILKCLLFMVVLRGICNWNSFSNCHFRIIFPHFTWLPHPMLSSFTIWAPNSLWPQLCLVFDSCWS